MENRLSEPGYLATEYQPSSLDIATDFESFYNMGSENKKLTQLTAPSRIPGEFSYFRGDLTDQAIDMRGYTTVTVEESDFLDDFMALAPDFGAKDRSNLGSLTDLNFCGSLNELDNLPRNSEPQHTSISTSQAQSYSKSSSSIHEQENRFPGRRRIHSSAFAPSSHHQVGSKSLKVMKQKSVGSNESPSGVSLLRQQLQGTLCSTKYKKAQETICKDCNQPFTTKCLLQVCRKSDEVLCQRCGQELTAKCLLQSCSERPQNSFWTKLELTSKWIISNFKWPLSKFIKA